jgi:hypothetical protein
VFKARPNRPPSAKEDDDFDCDCRNERHVDDGKNTFLKTPTFTEEDKKIQKKKKKKKKKKKFPSKTPLVSKRSRAKTRTRDETLF